MTTNETAPEAAADSGAATKASDAQAKAPPPVDLWDSDWDSGQYYWTVVPVAKNNAGEYQDLVVPQYACQAGNVQMFKKRSTKQSLRKYTLSSKTHRLVAGAPYITGLSSSGRLLSASSSDTAFYGVPLVAWTPSTGATLYDVEWSKKSYPWRKAGGLQTPATSALLPLKPGTWYYRVRGNNPWLPGNKKLRWSGPVRVEIAKPTFKVVGG